MSHDAELLAYSRLVAGELRRRWPTIDPDDIASEICLYVLTNDKVHAEWTDYMEGGFEDQEAERYASRRMRMIARRAGVRYCRREIAAQLGYQASDEAFYGIAQLTALVEVYYREGVTDQPLIGRADSVTSGLVHSEAYLASLLDVDRGLKLLARKYRSRLAFRFKDMGQYDAKTIAAMVENLAVAPGTRKRIEKHLGTNEKMITMRVRRAVRRLQDVLGGPNPYIKDDVELAA